MDVAFFAAMIRFADPVNCLFLCVLIFVLIALLTAIETELDIPWVVVYYKALGREMAFEQTKKVLGGCFLWLTMAIFKVIVGRVDGFCKKSTAC